MKQTTIARRAAFLPALALALVAAAPAPTRPLPGSGVHPGGPPGTVAPHPIQMKPMAPVIQHPLPPVRPVPPAAQPIAPPAPRKFAPVPVPVHQPGQPPR